VRKLLICTAVVGCSLALLLQADAQTPGGAAQPFFGAYTPQNLAMKPVSFNSTMAPQNMTSIMSPQSQSTKVFNIQSAFHNITMPLFRSHVPSTPIIKPQQQVKPH
jgi:hypothetical protein